MAFARIFLKDIITKIDFDKFKINSRHSNSIKAFKSESFEPMFCKVEICNDSVSFIIPEICINSIKEVRLYIQPVLEITKFNIVLPADGAESSNFNNASLTEFYVC